MKRYTFSGVLCLAALCATHQRATAQTTIFNSNGFESPTFNTGAINGQQGFLALPASSAGTIQTGTVQAGTQAFQINGSALVNDTSVSSQNFWYRTLATTSNFNLINPVAAGTPFVQVHSSMRMSGAIPNLSDIPFAGPYIEGFANVPFFGATQQTLTPIYLSTDGSFRVFTNASTPGSSNNVITSNQTFDREVWLDVMAELNFNTQSFSVYVNGEQLTFGTSNLTSVPFRNTNGTTVSIAEIGYTASYNTEFSPTLNNFFGDNFYVTMTAVSMSPVPEPSTCFAVGLAAAAGYRRWRKRHEKKTA